MAERLDSFDFKQKTSNNTLYNWDVWLDGQVWKLYEGKDFSVTCRVFRNAADGYARRRNGKLLSQIFDGEGGRGIIIKFETLSDSELAERALRSAKLSENRNQVSKALHGPQPPKGPPMPPPPPGMPNSVIVSHDDEEESDFDPSEGYA